MIAKNTLKGFLFSMLGTIFLASNFVAVKYALQGFNAITLCVLWTLFASFWVVIFILATGKGRQIKLPLRSLPEIIAMGFATAMATFFTWSGLAFLDPSFASFLWRFVPVLSILFSAFFLKERLMGKELMPIGIMVLGSCLGTLGRWHVVGSGVIMIFIAFIAIAVQNMIAKMKIKKAHSSVLSLYRVVMATFTVMRCLCIQ